LEPLNFGAVALSALYYKCEENSFIFISADRQTDKHSIVQCKQTVWLPKGLPHGKNALLQRILALMMKKGEKRKNVFTKPQFKTH